MAIRAGRVVLGLMVLALLAGSAFAAPASVISDQLQPVVQAADADEMIPVVVLMRERQNLDELNAAVYGLRGDARQAAMWDEVKLHADASQEALLTQLHEFELRNQVQKIRSLKMANAVDFDATPAAIQALAERSDIWAIHYTPDRKLIEDQPNSVEVGGELDEIAWGVNTVNAQACWDLGLTGEGVVLAIIDTGVNYNHVDLADHLWDGSPTYPNHGYDCYNNDDDPMDDMSHGTHCAGTAVGDGTAGSQTGVAPDATLMCVKVLNAFGNGSEPDVWAGMDFTLEQGADVTSMSLGFYNIAGDLRATFRENYDIMNAAGMVNLVAAGNEGTGWPAVPDQVRTPGNVPPPWQHPDQVEDGDPSGVITIGATDINDIIANFSSHGPVTWDYISPFFDYAYNPGGGLIDPDVSAPGVNVKSLNYANNTGYLDGWNGTSMATPHVAGAVALLLQAEPNLLPSEVNEALEMSAVELGAPGKDNSYGSGRLDCLAAVDYLDYVGLMINVTVDPLWDEPYYIPANGGAMQFDVNLHNNYDVPTPGVVWTQAILPNGNVYPINTYNVMFQPGVDIIVNGAQQYVPGNAPDGLYTFIVNGGEVFGTPIDMDGFDFVKFGWQADGSGEWSSTGFTEAIIAAEEGAVKANLPSEYALGKAYPNPFNPSTSIAVSLPQASDLTVSVFNVMGQQVAELAHGKFNAGEHSFSFDASNLSSGLYFIQAQVPGELNAIQKVTLMK